MKNKHTLQLSLSSNEYEGDSDQNEIILDGTVLQGCTAVMLKADNNGYTHAVLELSINTILNTVAEITSRIRDEEDEEGEEDETVGYLASNLHAACNDNGPVRHLNGSAIDIDDYRSIVKNFMSLTFDNFKPTPVTHSKVRVVVVGFNNDMNALKHGHIQKQRWQVKLVGVDGKVDWQNEPSGESRAIVRARRWGNLLGVEYETESRLQYGLLGRE